MSDKKEPKNRAHAEELARLRARKEQTDSVMFKISELEAMLADAKGQLAEEQSLLEDVEVELPAQLEEHLDLKTRVEEAEAVLEGLRTKRDVYETKVTEYKGKKRGVEESLELIERRIAELTGRKIGYQWRLKERQLAEQEVKGLTKEKHGEIKAAAEEALRERRKMMEAEIKRIKEEFARYKTTIVEKSNAEFKTYVSGLKETLRPYIQTKRGKELIAGTVSALRQINDDPETKQLKVDLEGVTASLEKWASQFEEADGEYTTARDQHAQDSQRLEELEQAIDDTRREVYGGPEPAAMLLGTLQTAGLAPGPEMLQLTAGKESVPPPKETDSDVDFEDKPLNTIQAEAAEGTSDIPTAQEIADSLPPVDDDGDNMEPTGVASVAPLANPDAGKGQNEVSGALVLSDVATFAKDIAKQRAGSSAPPSEEDHDGEPLSQTGISTVAADVDENGLVRQREALLNGDQDGTDLFSEEGMSSGLFTQPPPREVTHPSDEEKGRSSTVEEISQAYNPATDAELPPAEMNLEQSIEIDFPEEHPLMTYIPSEIEPTLAYLNTLEFMTRMKTAVEGIIEKVKENQSFGEPTLTASDIEMMREDDHELRDYVTTMKCLLETFLGNYNASLDDAIETHTKGSDDVPEVDYSDRNMFLGHEVKEILEVNVLTRMLKLRQLQEVLTGVDVAAEPQLLDELNLDNLLNGIDIGISQLSNTSLFPGREGEAYAQQTEFYVQAALKLLD